MSATSPRLLVACFCAAWCRTCDDYKQVIHTLKAKYSPQVEFAWVDIEDHSEVLDDVDVENFPTLLISDAAQLYFWGTVLPHASTAAQLVDRTLSGAMPAMDQSDIHQLDQRVRSFLYTPTLLTNK